MSASWEKHIQIIANAINTRNIIIIWSNNLTDKSTLSIVSASKNVALQKIKNALTVVLIGIYPNYVHFINKISEVGLDEWGVR
jgi:hypothetical protein